MGYRSDVKLVITTDKTILPASKILSLLDKNLIDDWESYGYHFDTFKSKDNIEKIYFQADYIKWYEWYEDIMTFETWLKEISKIILKSPCDSLGYHFVRIGEETDDIESTIFGEPTEYINIFRGSEFNKVSE